MPNPVDGRPRGLPTALRPSADEPASPEPTTGTPVDTSGVPSDAADPPSAQPAPATARRSGPAPGDAGPAPTDAGPAPDAAPVEPAEPDEPEPVGGAPATPVAADPVDVMDRLDSRSHLPGISRPNDTVSSIVDRGRDVRPRFTAPSAATSTDVGGTTVDVRADANRLRGEVDGGSGPIRGSASSELNTRGVDSRGRVDIDHGSDGSGATSVDGRLDFDPSGDPSWRVGVDSRDRATSDRGRSRAANVAAEIERRRGGGLRGDFDSNVHTRDADRDVRHTTDADFRHDPNRTSGSVDHRVNADLNGDRYDGHVNVDATRSGDRYSADFTVDGTRTLADSNTRDEVDITGRLDTGGDNRVRGTVTSARDVGDNTVVSGTGRFDVDRTDTDLGGSVSVTTGDRANGTTIDADADVTLADRVRGSGSLTVEDVTTTDGVRTRTYGTLRGSGDVDGVSGDLTGGVNTRDGDGTRDITGGVAGRWNRGSGPTGGVNARYHDVNGRGDDRRETEVDVDVDATRDRVTLAGEARHDRGASATTATGGAIDGRATIDRDGHVSGTVTGRGRATFGDDGDVVVDGRGNARFDSDRGVTADGDVRTRFNVGDPDRGGAAVDATIDARGSSTDGVRGGATVTATGVAGPADARTRWRGTAGANVDGDTVRATADANVHYGDRRSPVEVDGNARADVTISPDNVTTTASVDGTVTTRDDAGSTETHGAVGTDGGAPAVVFRHTRSDAGGGDSVRVEANAEFSDRAATIEYERRRRNRSTGNYDRMRGRLGVTPDVVDGSIDLERPFGTNIENATVTGRVGRRGLSVAADARVDRGTRGGVDLGWEDRRLSGAGNVSLTRADGLTAVAEARLTGDDHTRDMLLNTTTAWNSRWGRAAVSIAGHMAKADKITVEDEVRDVPSLAGHRRVIMEDRGHIELAGGAGFAVAGFGAGFTARGGRLKAVAYITHRPSDEALALEDEAARAHIPDPARLDRLRTHDVLRVFASGDVGMSADLSVFGVGVAGRVMLRSDFAFTVEKLAEKTVRVTVEPQRVYGVGVDGQALVAVGSLDAEQARKLSQTFELDLSTPGGWDAYQKALEGELPAPGANGILQDPGMAVDLVHEMNEELPEGVTAIAFGRESSRRVSRSAGFRWTLFGRSVEDARTTTERDHAVAGGVVSEHSHETERVHRTFFSGTEKAGVFSVLEDETIRKPDGTVETTFKEARFGARFADDRVRGFDFQDVTEKLREVCGIEIADIPAEGQRERRTAELEVTAPASFFEEAFESWRTSVSMDRAAAAAGLDEDELLDFKIAISSATSAAARGKALQDFIADGGLEAVGTLVRTFPDLDVEIGGTTDLYDTSAREAEKLRAKYPAPVEAWELQEIVNRYHEVTDIEPKVRSALEAVKSDPFLDDDKRARETERLQSALDELQDIISLRHFELHQLELLRDHLPGGPMMWMAGDWSSGLRLYVEGMITEVGGMHR